MFCSYSKVVIYLSICLALSVGYALQFSSPSNQNSESTYPFIGEWHSHVVTPTAEIFCFEIELYAPDSWQMQANLLTSDKKDQQHSQTKTVLEASNRGEARIKFSAELSLGFQPKLTTMAQLYVYLSANVTVFNVSFQSNRCERQS
jgi:hypothetical protein